MARTVSSDEAMVLLLYTTRLPWYTTTVGQGQDRIAPGRMRITFDTTVCGAKKGFCRCVQGCDCHTRRQHTQAACRFAAKHTHIDTEGVAKVEQARPRHRLELRRWLARHLTKEQQATSVK